MEKKFLNLEFCLWSLELFLNVFSWFIYQGFTKTLKLNKLHWNSIEIGDLREGLIYLGQWHMGPLVKCLKVQSNWPMNHHSLHLCNWSNQFWLLTRSKRTDFYQV
jgi:hypothetical protein